MMRRPRYLDMRGMLAFLLLWLLSQRPSNGQELAAEIGKRKGSRPNPGTIYPALKGLKKAGLIEGERSGRTVTYTLTEKGRGELKLAREYFKRVFRDVCK